MNGALVLYSLGNTVFDQQEPAPVRRGTLVWANVDRSGIRSVAVLPFVIDPRGGKTGAADISSLWFSYPQIGSARDIIAENRGSPRSSGN